MQFACDVKLNSFMARIWILALIVQEIPIVLLLPLPLGAAQLLAEMATFHFKIMDLISDCLVLPSAS